MLKRWKMTAWLAVGAVLFVGLALWESSITPTHGEIPERANKAREYYEKAANVLQGLPAFLVIFVQWFGNLSPEDWTAFATVAIALFTIALVFVTNRQARLTRESINLARDEFISTHSPKLIVRYIHLTDPIINTENVQNVEIGFTVENIGGLSRRSLALLSSTDSG
jgi:hypothetical protein